MLSARDQKQPYRRWFCQGLGELSESTVCPSVCNNVTNSCTHLYKVQSALFCSLGKSSYLHLQFLVYEHYGHSLHSVVGTHLFFLFCIFLPASLSTYLPTILLFISIYYLSFIYLSIKPHFSKQWTLVSIFWKSVILIVMKMCLIIQKQLISLT